MISYNPSSLFVKTMGDNSDIDVENDTAKVNIIKFKETIYDKVYESLTTRQSRGLSKAIKGIERSVKMKAFPETATSTEESASPPQRASDDESEERASDVVQVENTDTIDLNRKVPKPKRKMMARRLFKFIGYQFPKMDPIALEVWCKSILTIMDVDASDFPLYGIEDPLFQNI